MFRTKDQILQIDTTSRVVLSGRLGYRSKNACVSYAFFAIKNKVGVDLLASLNKKESFRRLPLFFRRNCCRANVYTSGHSEVLSYYRNNVLYRMLLTTQTGRQELDTLLQDEQMSRLYEKFVVRCYLPHHPGLLPKVFLSIGVLRPIQKSSTGTKRQVRMIKWMTKY